MSKTKPAFLTLGLVFLLILSLPAAGYAMDVTLAWDANTEPDLAGYTIYYGTESGHPYDGEGALEGDSPVDILLDEDEDPDPSVVQFTLYDLPEGTYFFAVTAFDTTGLESGYSNEASTADLGGTSVVGGGVGGVGGGGGGGGCFVATAACAPNIPGKVTYLPLILVALIAGSAAAAKKSRK
jgi:hypothetical protein